MTLPRGHRLIPLSALDNRHLGRHVAVAGHAGILTDIIPCGARVVLGLEVGGARASTDWLDADECAEVWREEKR